MFWLCVAHVCYLLATAIGLYCTDLNKSHSVDRSDAKAPQGNAMVGDNSTQAFICFIFKDMSMTKITSRLVKVRVPDIIHVLQAPGKMYTRICVISDILPSEWPPVQVRKGVPHPPPTHREYRVALANGLIPLKQDFRDMVTTAVASDSRMFRAALVRLVARASGLQAPT